MGIRTRGVAALLAAAIGMALAIVPAGSAAAADYVFPSTNDINRANDSPTSTKSPKASAPSPSNSSTPPTPSPSSNTASTAKPSAPTPTPSSSATSSTPPSASTDAPHPSATPAPSPKPSPPPARRSTTRPRRRTRLGLRLDPLQRLSRAPTPSTRPTDFPHVNEVSTGLGTVTLEFVNTTNSLAVFEYRIDGQTVGHRPPPRRHRRRHPRHRLRRRTHPTRLRHQPRHPNLHRHQHRRSTTRPRRRTQLGLRLDPLQRLQEHQRHQPDQRTSPTSTKSPQASAPSPSNSSTPPTPSPCSNTASTAKPSCDNGPHPVVIGDVIHATVCVDGRTTPVCDTSPVTQTFTATSTVEVRLALGGERNWDFDWTPFNVGQPEAPSSDSTVEKSTSPTSKEDCKRGGWEAFGFRNQGQCIKFVNNAGDKPYDDHEEDNGDKDHDDEDRNRSRRPQRSRTADRDDRRHRDDRQDEARTQRRQGPPGRARCC